MNTKIYSLAIIFFLCCSIAKSQTLTFCDRVDGSGGAVNSYSTLTVQKNGTPVTFLFTLPKNTPCRNVNFDVYRIVNEKEVYQSTIKQPASSNNWVSKQMTFYQEGKYIVYVFDDEDKQLAKGTLMVKKSAQ